MAKKSKKPLIPEEVAEQSKKGWKAVTVPKADVSPGDAPDAVAPELDVSKKRYGMAVQGMKKPAKTQGNSFLVPLEPPAATDTRAGRKVSVIRDGKKIGDQG
jgi:hypothetical protein